MDRVLAVNPGTKPLQLTLDRLYPTVESPLTLGPYHLSPWSLWRPMACYVDLWWYRARDIANDN